MKKIVILALLVLTGIVWLFFSARIRVDIAAMRYDPNTQKLHLTDPPLIRSTSIPGNMQTGLVTLSDGESVKYWFVSHHIAGPGCARFDFSDGTKRYVYGSYFCCEVQIPDAQVKTKQDLITFLEKNNES
ncbi:MAG: hypothetical protein HC845_13075 [Akkermansiaceae bacterium]|nr:hypothetical protein [Akkermansiaceae bacterium]